MTRAMNEWDYVWRQTGLVMMHMDIHRNKAGCCCVPPFRCLLCPTHSMDLRYQDLSLNYMSLLGAVTGGVR